MAPPGETTQKHPPAPTSAVVYVLFHELSKEGGEIAHAIYDRLRHPDEDVWQSRVGIPVFIRSCAAPDGWTDVMTGTGDEQAVGNVKMAPLRLRRISLPGSGLTQEQRERLPVRTFVVPLVCDQLAADPRWHEALRGVVAELAPPGGAEGADGGGGSEPVARAVLMPVLLGSAGPGVVGLPDDQQVISAFRWTDGAAGDDATRQRRERVLRELFLWMIREMRACVEGRQDGDEAPVEIFLSHAKADKDSGPRVAEALRDTIAAMGHVRGWYDENDLLPGTAWKRLLDRAAGGSAAMIVVWSSRYASRPWCRRELAEARKVRRCGAPKGGEGDLGALVGGEVLCSVPVVVVDTLSPEGGVTRVPPELAALPTCRWEESAAARGVDMAIHEALMGLSNTLQARAIVRSVLPACAEGERVVAVTSPPDHSVISELARAGAMLVLHPGYGLSLSDQVAIEQRFKVGGVRLVRYDDWEWIGGGGPRNKLTNVTVQISAGGDGEGLPERGMLPEHLAELIYELVNTSLDEGANLVYAGKPGYLKLDLVDVIAGAAAEHTQAQAQAKTHPDAPSDVSRPPAMRGPPGPRVWFYTPWRPGVEVGPAEKARNLPACRFEDVYPPPGPTPRQPGDLVRLRAELEAASELHVWNEASALSEARRLCAEKAQVVVLAGGKRKGWGGIMPGLLEEITNARQRKNCLHIVVLSGFGGAASWLAELLENPSRIPTEVTAEAHLTPGSPFRRLTSSLGADRVHIESRWAAAREALSELADLHIHPRPWRDEPETDEKDRPYGPMVHIVKVDSLRGIRRMLREILHEVP